MNERESQASFSFGKAKMERLLKLATERNANAILEFGSGLTTARFCREFPTSRVVSVDNSPVFLEQTKHLCDSLSDEHSEPCLLVLPLRWQFYAYRAFRSYDLRVVPKVIKQHKFDLCFIDGPVQSHTLGGREFVLYCIFECLLPNALIVLDDYHRNDSKRCLKNWMNTYGEALQIISEEESMVILKKTEAKPVMTSLGYEGWARHHRNILKVGLKSIKSRLKQ